jgi:hypothetical protein
MIRGMSRSRRVAALLTVVVPAIVVVVVFFYTASSHPSGGAGLSKDQRPYSFPLIAAGGLVGWVLGTSALFALFADARRLPRYVLECAWAVIAAARPIGAGGRVRPAEAPSDGCWRGVSAWQLLVLAFIELPLFTFLLPLLLGWLLAPGVYDPIEAAGVLAMGMLAVGWAALLIRGALSGRTSSGRAER